MAKIRWEGVQKPHGRKYWFAQNHDREVMISQDKISLVLSYYHVYFRLDPHMEFSNTEAVFESLADAQKHSENWLFHDPDLEIELDHKVYDPRR